MDTSHRCVVCQAPCGPSALLLQGEPVGLCATHARRVKKGAPRAFDSLAAFFEGTGLERRVEVDRRRHDRRVFPPRPELRRRNHGRRSSDPRA
jgi:hypothetical protein